MLEQNEIDRIADAVSKRVMTRITEHFPNGDLTGGQQSQQGNTPGRGTGTGANQQGSGSSR